MPAPILKDCPREVLALIFSHFECSLPVREWWMNEPDKSTVGTLKSLCLTCHAFKDIAQPLLFRNVLLWHNDDSNASFILLAKVLLENPRLGLYARTFSFSYLDTYDVDEWEESFEGKLKVPERFRSFVEASFADGQINVLAFCMVFMPNLQVVDLMESSNTLPGTDTFLDMIGTEQGDHKDGDKSMRKAAVTIPFTHFGLPLLNEFRIQNRGNEMATGIKEVELMLLHPGVEVIRTVGIDWRGQKAAGLTCKERKSNVRVLELRECIIDHQGLSSVFNYCPHLESLSITLGDSRRAIEVRHNEWTAKADQFARVLRAKGRNLRTLNLHTTDGEPWYKEDGPMLSLEELKELRHIAVLRDDLTDEQPYEEPSYIKRLLPRGLETIDLHCNEYPSFGADRDNLHLNRELCDLITSEMFPNLRQITVERHYKEGTSFDHSIPGWSAEVTEEHLWNRPSSSGCVRTVITLKRQDWDGLVAGQSGFHSNSHELV